MLGDEGNGNDEKPEEAKAAVLEEAKGEAPKEEPNLNQAKIDSGVMTVTLYLEESNMAFASAIGSLVLAQDMVKNYFAKKMMVEAAMKERVMTKIIKPGLAN